MKSKKYSAANALRLPAAIRAGEYEAQGLYRRHTHRALGVAVALLSGPAAYADHCAVIDDTCISPATTTPYVCDQRQDTSAKPTNVSAINPEARITNRAIVFGGKFQFQTKFGQYDFQVGASCTSCLKAVGTAANHCPAPRWKQDFAQLHSTQSYKVLVTIWTNRAEGWDDTKFHIYKGGTTDSNYGAPIPTYPTAAAAYAAGLGNDITPMSIPGGAGQGRYFLLDVNTGDNATSSFTYRSSVVSRVGYAIQGKSVTEHGSVAVNDGGNKSFTDFKPALDFRSRPTTRTIAGGCSPDALTIESEDGDGNAVTTLPAVGGAPANPVKLALHSTPSTFTYLDPACNYPTTTESIQNPVPAPPAGSRPPESISSGYATFYFKTPNAYPALPISVDYIDNGDVIFTAFQNQVVTAGQPIGLVLRAPGSVAQNVCSSAIHVSFVDKYGNETKFSANKVINLSGSHFYLSAGCGGAAVTRFTATAGMSSQDFYMLDPTPQTARVQVNALEMQSAETEIIILGNSQLAHAVDMPHAKNMARRLYRRIAGTPLMDDGLLGKMSTLLLAGKALDAADLATQDNSFYNVTLKQLFTKMSNRLEDPSEPLSDFVATAIGIVHDNRDAREFLTGDRIYAAPDMAPTSSNSCANTTIYKNNASYAAIESAGTPLSSLVSVPQCAYASDNFTQDSPTLTTAEDAGGLLTTHKWGEQHMIAGTNRRPFEFALKQFNCLTMTQLADNSVGDSHVRRDVDRAPGNDPRTYATSCRSCHAMMDTAAGAFAYHNWYPNQDPNVTNDSRLFLMRGGYGGDAVMPKMNQNSVTFPSGWISSDNSWSLDLSDKQAALLGIDQGIATSGKGVHALGVTLSNSASFRSCMATRAFSLACLRAPGANDASSINDLANYFVTTGYNMRSLFERAAVLDQCLGRGDTQ